MYTENALRKRGAFFYVMSRNPLYDGTDPKTGIGWVEGRFIAVDPNN